MTSLYDIPLKTLEGDPVTLAEHKGKALLIVNVASRCGFTGQYKGLQAMYEHYRDRGFEILGFPCNQFLEQEPGSAEEIREFCSTTFGVTFPLFRKVDVNGPERHPVYEILTELPDDQGVAGDVQWNFEKFLVSPAGDVVGRFRTSIKPRDEGLVAAVEKQLPG